MNICEFLRKIRGGVCTDSGCLVSLQVGNAGELPLIRDGETRIVVVDGIYQTVTITDDEWQDMDALSDKIIALMLEQRRETGT